MKILFLCNKKTYTSKMSRVRFHSIHAIGKHPEVDLMITGPGFAGFPGCEGVDKKYNPDLVLLDIILPKMDGYKILSIIKNNPELKDIPVIMLTSKDGILNKVKGKVSGCEAYLTKPFDPQELIETVAKFT